MKLTTNFNSPSCYWQKKLIGKGFAILNEESPIEGVYGGTEYNNNLGIKVKTRQNPNSFLGRDV